MCSKPPMSKETKEYLIKKLRKMKETVRKQNKFSKKNNWIEFYKQKEKTKWKIFTMTAETTTNQITKTI